MSQPQSPPPLQRFGHEGIVSYVKPPSPGPLRWIWRHLVNIDAMFALSMLEWWESLIVWLVVLIIAALFWYSVISYSPGHIAYLTRRFSYYVFDDETVDAFAVLRMYMVQSAVAAWGWVKALPDVAGLGKIEL